MNNYELEMVAEEKLLAATIWAEARGETRQGREAVAWVIKNRAAKGGWYGHSINSVILKPWQFSCYNSGDPNRQKIIKLVTGQAYDNEFSDCESTARDVLSGICPDPTSGATHYHNFYTCHPEWAATLHETVTIGRHRFYK